MELSSVSETSSESEEENVKVKHSKSAKTKSQDKKDKQRKKQKNQTIQLLEDEAPVKKSKKDKGKETPGETGANVKVQNITISAKQFQEILEMIQ